MTIRAGDVFSDGTTRFWVYGFKIDTASENGRLMMCETPDGSKHLIDPWTLMEDCVLEKATAKPDSLLCFNSDGPYARGA